MMAKGKPPVRRLPQPEAMKAAAERAAARYEERSAEVRNKLRSLGHRIEDHEPVRPHWGDVGDLAHIADLLDQALDFLSAGGSR